MIRPWSCVRNELRPTGPAIMQTGRLKIERPFVSGDVGWARDLATDRTWTLGSVGVGDTATFGPLAVSFMASDPLASGPATRAGRWRLDVKVVASF